MHTNQEQITLNFNQNPLDVNKHIRDLDYSKALEEKSFIFDDGDDRHVDIFLFKVGVNGNGFGVGLDTAEQRANEFIGRDIIVDPYGITHKNGARSLPFIEANQGKLSVGKVNKIKMYDLDHDGKYDFFRGLGLLDKDPQKQELFDKALAAGINETSPTIMPLNLDEDVTNMLTWKPINVAIVKNGAYFQDAKIRALCKGSKKSCSNALAASLQQNSNTPLITAFTKSGYMGDSNDSNANNQGSGQPPSSTQNQGSSPLVSIFTSGSQANSPSSPLNSGIAPPTNKGESNEKPDNGNNNNRPEEKPAEESEEVKALRKENAAYRESLRANLWDQMLPVDLFNGNVDERAKFLKEHTKDKDVITTQAIHDFNKAYLPLFTKFYLANQAKTDTSNQTENKDNQGKKNENPLAGSLEMPKFDNSTGNNPVKEQEAMQKYFGKMSLRQLDQFAAKMKKQDGNEGVII